MLDVIGPDDAGCERLRRYFEESFRDLFLTEVRNANDRGLLMGTFVIAVSFVDALAITYAGKQKGLDKNWERFVTRYFPQPEYARVAAIYHEFRSRVLHNFSSPKINFIHNRPEFHMPNANPIILNRENFVTDVGNAFEFFYTDVQRQPALAMTVLAFLDACPPLTVKPIELPSSLESQTPRIVNASGVNASGGATSFTGNDKK